MMTEMKSRLLAATKRFNRVSNQDALWSHVRKNQGWCVKVTGPDVDLGQTDATGLVFEITEIWARARLYSASGIYLYPKEALRIIDCPPEFKHLL